LNESGWDKQAFALDGGDGNQSRSLGMKLKYFHPKFLGKRGRMNEIRKVLP